MISYLIFGVSLLGASVLLIGRHLLVWRREQSTVQGPERTYLRRQTVLRLQTSFLLGLAGVVIASVAWLPPSLLPVVFLLLLGLIVWILCLAGTDFLLTRRHYRELNRVLEGQRAELEQELDQYDHDQRNGHPSSPALPARESS